jgi:hypothetical protein
VSRTSRRLVRAIRVAPAADRERYAPEWLGDAQAAASLGLPASQVARGATRIAWRLRLRRTRRVLAGAEGPWRALGGWAAVAVIAPLAHFLGGPLLLLALPVALLSPLLLVFRSRWRTGIVIMTGSAALWLGCTVAFWWLWGIGFDAADAMQPLPPVIIWSARSFFVGLGAFLVFWATFLVGLVRCSWTRPAAARSAAS